MTVLRLTLRSPRGLLLHWLSLFGASLGLHLIAIVGLVVLPRLLQPRVNLPDIYTVNLVSLPAGEPGPKAGPPAEKPAAVPAPAPAPPAAKPKPAIKIPEKPTAKLVKPKPATKTPPPAPKQKQEAPTPERPSASETEREAAPEQAKPEAGGNAAASAGGATGGGGGGGAGGLLDDATFQYGWYLSRMNSIFSSNWTRPIKPDLDHPLRAKVHFTIQKDGRLTDIVLEQSSGDAALDRSALRAIQDSNPLPQLPFQYGKDSLGVHFFFDLVPD